MSTVVDGNALAGVLAEFLGPDASRALLRCAGCGSIGLLAQTRVHASPMGSVARCRDCDTALVTVVDGPDRHWVGFPGARAVSTSID
jgi:hypothetical protein